jgi:hypothetical protein
VKRVETGADTIDKNRRFQYVASGVQATPCVQKLTGDQTNDACAWNIFWLVDCPGWNQRLDTQQMRTKSVGEHSCS